MKNLRDIVESLLDAENDDQFTPEQVHGMNIWNELCESPKNWEPAMERLLNEILSKKVKSIKLPRFNYRNIQTFRKKLSNDAYYLYIKRDYRGNLDIVATSHGIEKMYGFLSDKLPNYKNVFVHQCTMTPAELYTAPNGSVMSLYILPKEYKWLYERMKDRFENDN